MDKMYLTLAFLAFALLYGNVSTTPIATTDIEPLLQEVTEGESFQFVCKAGGPISSCTIKTPENETHELNPKAEQYATTYGMIYKGDGFEAGDCGFMMFMAESSLNGSFTCKMRKSAEEIEGTMQLSVKHMPVRTTLTLDHEDRKYVEGQPLEATCRVYNFGSPANITWFLNSERITDGVQSPSLWSVTPGTVNLVQKLVRVVTKEDHGKTLRCDAKHSDAIWDRGLDDSAELQFSVRPVA